MSKQVTHKVKQIVVHPRYECRTGCADCYLQKDVKGVAEWRAALENKPIEIMKSYLEILEDINQCGPSFYDEVQFSYMLNNSNSPKEISDILFMNTLLRMHAATNIPAPNEIALYVNKASLIRKPDAIHAYITEEMLAYRQDSDEEDRGATKPSIWISDGIDEELTLFRNGECTNVIQDWINHGMLNFTITISESTDIEKIIGSINAIHPVLMSAGKGFKYVIYLNIINIDGKIANGTLNKAIALHHHFLKDTTVNVVLDSCISNMGSNTQTDINHIFPNGMVKNCPYIHYSINMNQISKKDYCDTLCPLRPKE